MAIRKRVQVWYKGHNYAVANISVNGGTAYGRVQGRDVSTSYYDGDTDLKIAHRLLEKKFAEYGNVPSNTRDGQCMVGDYEVLHVRTVKRDDGSAYATGIIKGRTVSATYSGIVTSESGSSNGKPWLRRVREDLVKAYERDYVAPKPTITTTVPIVDADYMREINECRRLKAVGFSVQIDGTETIDLFTYSGNKRELLTQVAATKLIENALRKLDDQIEKDKAYVRAFFERMKGA